MVQLVVNTYVRIRNAILMAWMFLKQRVHDFIDLVLDRIVIFLCRHYGRSMGNHGYDGY